MGSFSTLSFKMWGVRQEASVVASFCGVFV